MGARKIAAHPAYLCQTALTKKKLLNYEALQESRLDPVLHYLETRPQSKERAMKEVTYIALEILALVLLIVTGTNVASQRRLR